MREKGEKGDKIDEGEYIGERREKR